MVRWVGLQLNFWPKKYIYSLLEALSLSYSGGIFHLHYYSDCAKILFEAAQSRKWMKMYFWDRSGFRGRNVNFYLHCWVLRQRGSTFPRLPTFQKSIYENPSARWYEITVLYQGVNWLALDIRTWTIQGYTSTEHTACHQCQTKLILGLVYI